MLLTDAHAGDRSIGVMIRDNNNSIERMHARRAGYHRQKMVVEEFNLNMSAVQVEKELTASFDGTKAINKLVATDDSIADVIGVMEDANHTVCTDRSVTEDDDEVDDIMAQSHQLYLDQKLGVVPVSPLTQPTDTKMSTPQRPINVKCDVFDDLT